MQTYHDVPVQWLDVGHSQLAYRCLGRGADVVFVHGWPLHAATFRAIAPRLAARFRCHLFDLPGAGETRVSARTPLDLRAHATTLRAAIDQLGLARYALVAHDSGGLVARLLAASDHRVAGLVLGNTELPDHHPWLVRLMHALLNAPGGKHALGMVLSQPHLRKSALGFGSCFRDRRLIDGEFHAEFIAPLLTSRRRAALQMELVRTLDLSLVRGLRDVHARIEAPVQLIWGDRDPFFPLALARSMMPEFPGGAALEILQGYKLFAHEEQPARFSAIAEGFLGSVLSTRTTLMAGGT